MPYHIRPAVLSTLCDAAPLLIEKHHVILERCEVVLSTSCWLAPHLTVGLVSDPLMLLLLL